MEEREWAWRGDVRRLDSVSEEEDMDPGGIGEDLREHLDSLLQMEMRFFVFHFLFADASGERL